MPVAVPLGELRLPTEVGLRVTVPHAAVTAALLLGFVAAHGGFAAGESRAVDGKRQAVPFLLALAADFSAQNEWLTETIDRVRMRVAHIVDLIRTQTAFDSASMTRKVVDLPQAVADAVKVLAESCRARGIAVRIDCGRAPRELWIQESRFNQMLVNLVKNSVEAIDALGKAGGAGTENAHIRIDSYPQDEFLVIDVTDTGIGIEESRLRRVFAAGYSTKANSSGLGLHSAANFVISIGGSIEALSSGHGMGATIRVKLRRTALIRE